VKPSRHLQTMLSRNTLSSWWLEFLKKMQNGMIIFIMFRKAKFVVYLLLFTDSFYWIAKDLQKVHSECFIWDLLRARSLFMITLFNIAFYLSTNMQYPRIENNKSAFCVKKNVKWFSFYDFKTKKTGEIFSWFD